MQAKLYVTVVIILLGQLCGSSDFSGALRQTASNAEYRSNNQKSNFGEVHDAQNEKFRLELYQRS